jgi:hypothetical protein
MEIMGIRIPTVVQDNVATRCDGCLEVIDGTPWRINLLDIVSTEVAAPWTTARDQSRAVPVPPDEPCVRSWMAARGFLFCRKGQVREIMRPIPVPSETARPSAGASATASIATTTSSCRPEPCRRPGRPAAAAPSIDGAGRGSIIRMTRVPGGPRFTHIPSGVCASARCDASAAADDRSRSARRAGSSASIPTRSAAGRTRAGSRLHDRRRPSPVPAASPLERILQARRHDATVRLATLGATTDRLSRAYRRGYPIGAAAGGSATRRRRRSRGLPRRRAGARGGAPRPSRRRDDADREPAETEAVAATDALAGRVRGAGIPLADAVSLFVAARSPFLTELGAIARRRSVDPDRLSRDLRPLVRPRSTGSSSGSSRPTSSAGLTMPTVAPGRDRSILALVFASPCSTSGASDAGGSS